MGFPSEREKSLPSTSKSRETLRLLFLDDDPARAKIFLAENPRAIWVETVEECLAKLEEPWHEVHLDHDLGGEHFVRNDREDCGMEVVRWLSLAPRPHLKATQFFIHSHNPNAATMMGMQLMVNGYKVEVRPFGSDEVVSISSQTQGAALKPTKSLLDRILVKLASLLRPRSAAVDPEVLAYVRTVAENRARMAKAEAEARLSGGPTPPSSLPSNGEPRA